MLPDRRPVVASAAEFATNLRTYARGFDARRLPRPRVLPPGGVLVERASALAELASAMTDEVEAIVAFDQGETGTLAA